MSHNTNVSLVQFDYKKAASVYFGAQGTFKHDRKVGDDAGEESHRLRWEGRCFTLTQLNG